MPADWDFTNYSPFPNENLVRQQLLLMADMVPGGFSKAIPADIALIRDHKYRVHMGVIVPGHEGTFNLVHASMLERRVVEHIIDEEWQREIRSVFRYRGVDD